MAEQRPIAVFDIDGTLIRWQLYHAIVDKLIYSGSINNPKIIEEINAARINWEHRKNNSAFEDYEIVLIKYSKEIIKNISKEELTSISKSVFDNYKNKIYRYTSQLIKDLKKKQYLVFCISGSPEIIIKMIADYYGFDDYLGSRLSNFDDDFLIMTHDNKAKNLIKLVEKYHTSLKNSIAVGDSDGDIPLLNSVQTAIAFNPNKKLLTYAQNKSWQIVIERKNVIYQLLKIDGKYVLANTRH